MNDYITKDAPQETLLHPDDPWITTESDVKLYILEPLDNIKLSRSQYIATSIINYGPYKDSMFALENFAYALGRQPSTVITLKPPIPCLDPLMHRYHKILHDRYSNIVFLIKQITKQHCNFNLAWNNINNHPNIPNKTFRHKRGIFFNHSKFSLQTIKKPNSKSTEKECCHSYGKSKFTAICT